MRFSFVFTSVALLLLQAVNARALVQESVMKGSFTNGLAKGQPLPAPVPVSAYPPGDVDQNYEPESGLNMQPGLPSPPIGKSMGAPLGGSTSVRGAVKNKAQDLSAKLTTGVSNGWAQTKQGLTNTAVQTNKMASNQWRQVKTGVLGVVSPKTQRESDKMSLTTKNPQSNTKNFLPGRQPASQPESVPLPQPQANSPVMMARRQLSQSANVVRRWQA